MAPERMTVKELLGVTMSITVSKRGYDAGSSPAGVTQ